MTLFGPKVPLPPIPDDVSIPQFMLRAAGRLRPLRPSNVPFFIEDKTGRAVSFEEVHYRTYGLANALSIKWNIGVKDVVCLFTPNHVDYAPAIWAVHTLGGIITPANPNYTSDELKYQLTTSKAKLLITHPNCLDTARSAAHAYGLTDASIILLDPSPTPGITTAEELISFGASRPENYKAIVYKPGETKKTLAFLSFSSGTTGKPKAVAITHFSVVANISQMSAHYHMDDPSYPHKRIIPGDVIMGVLPFFHIYGLVVILHFTLWAGTSIVVVPKFNFTDFLNTISRHRVTHLYLVPPQIVLLTKHPAVKGRDFSHVKFCMSGAAPLSGDLMKQLTKILPNASIGQGYGLTETCTTISQLQPERMLGTIGSAGALIPGVVAKVVKADGTLAKEGEQGELIVTGPWMPREYYGNPTATAETFVDGWVRTGDEVIIRDNEIFVVDRLKEIMKVRGFQVAPAELEGHLLLHPDVVDVCVVGVPDDYSGEVPMAFVVPSSNALKRINQGQGQAVKKMIEKHVSDAKIQYKWLAGGVEFIDAIPKNPSGKILRRVLREKAKTFVRPQRVIQPKL